MSQNTHSNESRSQYLLWPSIESNSKNIPVVLEKAPLHKLSFNTLKTNLVKFTPVSSNSASSSPISPISFASINYKDTRSLKEHLPTNLNPDKDLRVPEQSFVPRVEEDISRDSKPSESQTKSFTRSISEPVLIKNTKDSELSTLGAEASSSSEDCAQMARTAPRSVSNESALSYFTEKHLSKTPHDVSFSTEITNLVSTVGSAEIVIAYLLREKNSQAAQNSQLWRLVDKQRAMILGLNKDLERALRDKERYRKKVREFVAKASTTESSNPNRKINSIDEIEIEGVENSYHKTLEDTNSIDMKSSDENNSESPTGLVLAPYPITPKSENFNIKSPTDISGTEFEIMNPTEQDLHQTSQINLNLSYQDEVQAIDKIANQIASIKKSSKDDNLVPKPLSVKQSPSKTEALIEGFHEIKKNKKSVISPHRKAPPASLELGNGSNSKFRFQSAPDISMLNESTPIRTSLFNTFRGSIGLPSSPRHMHIVAASAQSIRDLKTSINSPPVSPTNDNSEANFPLLSPTILAQPILPLPRTPVSTKSMEDIKQEITDSTSPSIVNLQESKNDQESANDNIFKGFITNEYPGLLLPPNALDKVNVKVASSRMKPSRASMMFPKNTEEDPVFSLAIFAKSDQKELWRVEKDFLSLTLLDQSLKECSNYNAKFPERSLFSGHAPAKVDARRQALNDYLEVILKIQSDIDAALEICKYLSLNALGAYTENFIPRDIPGKAHVSSLVNGTEGKPQKNGYLTKRGKNFGGWKARYFVLDGPVLHYFESPGGPCLGSIRLQSAQIGKQSQPNEKSASNGEGDDTESKYRHAFLILEPRRKESSNVIRHVLCAESDLERDQWVDALCQYINHKGQTEKNSTYEQKTQKGSNSNNYKTKIQSQKVQSSQGSKETLFRGISYEDTKPKDKPTLGQKSESLDGPSPIEIPLDRESLETSSQPQSPNDISKQTSLSQGQVGQSSRQGTPHSSISEKISGEKVKHRKRSFFGFGTKTKIPVETSDLGAANTSNGQTSNEKQKLAKNTFGAPLYDAVRYSRPSDANIEVPAVVYRCVEYLDAKNAFQEEGIFRLSGSNLVIKGLRERFNSEGDINLLVDDQYYDIHAVASLLKLYLRELPSTILTRQLHVEFLAVADLPDSNDRIGALSNLVDRLPNENQALLKYLSSFLIKIIDNSDVNKMSIRNVGIVFSPTLNIPAAIFTLFLQQYSKIFGVEPDYRSAPVSDTSSLNSSNDLNNLQAPSAAKVSEVHRVASKLAGPTFIKTIGASKSYRQNISENSTVKIKRRDSSMFGMNVPSLSQSKGGK